MRLINPPRTVELVSAPRPGYNRRMWLFLRHLPLWATLVGLILPGCSSKQPAVAPGTPTAPGAVRSPGRSPKHPAPSAWPRYTLRPAETWQLTPPGGGRFDASALLELPSGELLTLADRGATIYRIVFRAGTNSADLVELPDCFTQAQLAPFAAEKFERYDCEGIGRDEEGRLYVCEEANRWVLRWDPQTKKVERLNIDWSPVKRFFSSDRNASFEGVAAGAGKLYVANERSVGRIIVVDLKSLQVVDDFTVNPTGSNAQDVHYTDLCWFEGSLYALLRESGVVLRINPATHRVLTEYDYNELEHAPEYEYRRIYPTGTMEGLAVDRDFIWLATDNNGQGRVRYPRDIRPTLFKCPRPDK